MKEQRRTGTCACRIVFLTLVLFGLQASNIFGQFVNCKPKEGEEKTLHKAAAAAFRSAFPIVYGLPINAFVFARQDDYLACQIVKDPAWITKGFKLTDAVAHFKHELAINKESRTSTINVAFQEVYGRAATPAEFPYWDAQVKAEKAWYAPIVTAELGKLGSNSSERTAMIHRAYQRAMGRLATRTDIGYWFSRKDHYRLIEQASRSWLYSPGGATDLSETINRALQTKNGKKPSDAEVKSATIAYTPQKWLYAEMIK